MSDGFNATFTPDWVSIMTDNEGTWFVAPGVKVLLPGPWSSFQQNLLFQALLSGQGRT